MYDDLNFEDELQLSKSQIRRRHNARRFLRRNAELLQQELELEDELLESNPELSQMIHDLNVLETQAHHQGFGSVTQGESTSQKQNIWSKLFPGLGGSNGLG